MWRLSIVHQSESESINDTHACSTYVAVCESSCASNPEVSELGAEGGDVLVPVRAGDVFMSINSAKKKKAVDGGLGEESRSRRSIIVVYSPSLEDEPF